MGKLYSKLHKLYSLSKTLRFELIPVGKTKEYIKEKQIIEEDLDREKAYKRVKKYCDEYHKKFIEKALSEVRLDELDKYYELYSIGKKNEKQIEELKKIKNNLRKRIETTFKKDSEYKGLFKSEMIKKYLKNFYKDEEILKDIDGFKEFTTYFSGYNKNRENMYVGEDKSTAIAYRLIDENLPTFIANMNIYQDIKDKISLDVDRLSKELNVNLDEIFTLKYYNNVLTQSGIESYNLIISGRAEEGNKKIKGINEYINEYKQRTKEKLPKFKELYKQILSDRESNSFVFETIENDKELLDMIDEYVSQFNDCFEVEEVLGNIDSYDTTKIYVNNDSTITNIASKLYNDWRYINDKLNEKYEQEYTGREKINSEKYILKRDKYFKAKKVFSIAELNALCDNDNKILEYIKEGIKNTKYMEKDDENKEGNISIVEKIKECTEDYNKMKSRYYAEETQLVKEDKAIEIIKKLLDSMKRMQEFVKMIIPKDRAIDKEDAFYNDLMKYYDVLDELIPVYNKTRNYLTKKPFSTEKTKINFECATLLNGWDLNKEKEYLGVILLKDGNYYLGIMNPYCKNMFDKHIKNINEDKNYKKMEYKQLSGLNKNLPRIGLKDRFNPPEELKRKYEEGKHTKGENFDIDFCHELIDFFKHVINTYDYWKDKNIEFSDTETYKDISEFYKEAEGKLYDINYRDYDEDYINGLVERGELYLFWIYNKDFSPYSKGRKNLHTLYWNAVFDERNLEDVVYKLNGQAEIFYRKASLKLEETAIHNANCDIENKNIKNKKRVSNFSYDIIKDKRYTEDKFLFHVPITLNFKNKNIKNINSIVNKELKETDDYYVIGIDRGERNLIYISVVDKDGKIVHQESLNEIINEYNGNIYETDYHELLDKKEKERDRARKTWKTIENIKELKEGYLSQVVNKIVKLMNKYNAIIVLENLNYGFKNSRIKVEKQVYQKFEKMLIDKLNYLVFKDKDLEEGGIFNAYQLTNKFESFEKLGKQSGILFYIPAWCTSKIDPTTGFINLFYVKYESIEKANKFISKFEDIRFNEKEQYFEFDIDYTKFTDRLNDSKRYWTICTYKDRIENFRNEEKNSQWDSRRINLTEEFCKLFREYNIDKDNIKQSISAIRDVKFLKDFMRLFKLTVQMRNSIVGEEEDYLISPVKNKYDRFFDTREAEDDLPKDADANGAYNIARKGLMLIKQIKETEDEKLSKIKYDITNKEWLQYAQDEENL